MRNPQSLRRLLGGASLAALVVAVAADAQAQGRYLSGDFHNHTTCQDGSASVQFDIQQAFKNRLDWYIDMNHGGSGNRDCRFIDPTYSAYVDPIAGRTIEGNVVPPATVFWDQTIGAARIKGNVISSGGHRSMWRWQMVEEFNYPLDVKGKKDFTNNANQVFIGIENIVPGHEHADTTIINNQTPKRSLTADTSNLDKFETFGNINPNIGNASPVAQFEYLYDRADADTSQDARWPGKDATVRRQHRRRRPRQGRPRRAASCRPTTR